MAVLAGCDEFGKVDQGRTIAYDKANKTISIIRDKSPDPKTPDYSALPPVTYRLPDDPAEMGPEPEAGKRMKLDLDKKQITIFDPNINNFSIIDYSVVEQKDIIDPNDPALSDPVTKEPKPFPLMDEARKTITIFSKRQNVLLTFVVPEPYTAYPPDTWKSGDDVRIYYKEEGRAERFMNISKTDIYKK